MSAITDQSARGAFASLQQFVRSPRKSEEVCELCVAPLGPAHQHLFNLDTSGILCACDACAVLFLDETRQRYRRIPRDVQRIEFSMDDTEWECLQIPIKLAFFVYVSKVQRMVAYYPSPAGAMESSLDLTDWDSIARRNPVLQRFAPDVEALLVNRLSHQPRYYRAPIDCCYRLIGAIRMHWRGFSGGDEVWKQLDEFFRCFDEASGVRCA